MTRKLLFFAGAAFLLSMSMPASSFAADAFKDVIVRNTVANPVPVQVTGEAPQLRHGDQVIGPPGGEAPRDAVIPPDVVLTDLVVTRARGDADSCNVALFEDRAGNFVSLAHLFPTIADASRSLHFVSGLRTTANRLAVAVNNDCYILVLWSGYVPAR